MIPDQTTTTTTGPVLTAVGELLAAASDLAGGVTMGVLRVEDALIAAKEAAVDPGGLDAFDRRALDRATAAIYGNSWLAGVYRQGAHR